MKLKYNEVLGEIVKPNDEPATQSELFEWMMENPGRDEDNQKNTQLDEVIESLTVKETPDSTEIQEGVETITDRG
jgi:hypothetical protein|tara:strand:+ start:175 stop:399 length:225 start_codon:yes stop_codon:yes gene_type:complete